MTYDKIVDHLNEEKRHLMPVIMDKIHEGKLPHSLLEALHGFEDWEKEVDGKEGLEHAPKAEDVIRFAEQLDEHRDAFNTEDKKRIDEFVKLAQALSVAAANPLGA